MKHLNINDIKPAPQPDTENSFETSVMNAVVETKLDSDETVKVTIDSQWFAAEDLDELIEFATYLKSRLFRA